MSVLNDDQLTTYAFKEAMARERHMFAKLNHLYGSGDRDIRTLCAGMMSSCQIRMEIIKREMKNFNIK